MSFWEGFTCHQLLKCVTKPINHTKKTANKPVIRLLLTVFLTYQVYTLE